MEHFFSLQDTKLMEYIKERRKRGRGRERESENRTWMIFFSVCQYLTCFWKSCVTQPTKRALFEQRLVILPTWCYVCGFAELTHRASFFDW